MTGVAVLESDDIVVAVTENGLGREEAADLEFTAA